MTALWISRFESAAASASQRLVALFEFLSRPTVLPRLQRGLIVLLCLWLLLSVWRAVLTFIPEAPPLPAQTVINPATASAASTERRAVDIEALAAAPLFGEPGEAPTPQELAATSGRAPTMSEEEAAVALAGIEDGAPETRLPLVLRGVVASSDAGLGQAIIEHRKQQDLYQVDDELPVNRKVRLAKVLPDLVVLDNGGRYEVLRLFEQTDLAAQMAENATLSTPVSSRSATEKAPERVKTVAQAPELAARYREQLYDNPESLAEVVRISAVREGDEIRGYRVSPGKAAQEFAALGFEAGDIVTAVNGLSLKDPANTIRLYQAMRSARSANFELERKGEVVSLDVSIGGDNPQ